MVHEEYNNSCQAREQCGVLGTLSHGGPEAEVSTSRTSDVQETLLRKHYI